MNFKILFITCLLIPAISSFAQTDTINAKNNKLRVQNLKEGTSNYAFYMAADSLSRKRSVGGIWQRTTAFKSLNGKRVVEFTWKSLVADTVMSTVTNICDANTLAPISHYSNAGKRGITAYLFTDGWMIPTDTVKNNLAFRKGKVELTIPVFNWEQDLETLSLLPVKNVGQQFAVSFFDPNEKATVYRKYEVIRKEELPVNSETKSRCWVFRINYGPDNWAMFWLTDRNKEVLKTVEFYKGRYFFKVKQY